ncbi:hypothetical protein NOI20_15795 [Rhodobacteraceae bacterium 10Alg 79]|uniref:Uncharacterized protein n=2 Tax=Rhodalgimonas zhirmunskyi TaxID=2964767 RepID=A0AAJ1UGQ0_9RHOB|nr:hypothetical protein [Rhodoalgimonas zhirmunskyi]
MTNMEIEDVLSSIRRLVSENARGDSKPEASSASDSAEQGPSDVDSKADTKAPMFTSVQGDSRREATNTASEAVEQTLVLTPALMVSQSDEAELEPAVDEAGDAPYSESDNDGEPDVADANVVSQEAVAAAVKDAIEEHVETAAQEAREETLQLDATFRHSDPEASDLEDRIAGLEAAVAAREDDWEPDGISESDNTAAPVDTLTWEDHDEVHGRGWESIEANEVEEAEFVDESAAALSEDGDEAQMAEPAFPSGDEAKLAALASLMDAARKGTETDPATETSTPAATESDNDAPASFLGENDAVLDEEMLRELVAEIVRQELQGSLGERITRNVRKLVRREIHRALTARDMD